jgi:hypothetical protein
MARKQEFLADEGDCGCDEIDVDKSRGFMSDATTIADTNQKASK